MLELTRKRVHRAASTVLLAYTFSFFVELPNARADAPSTEASAEARRNDAKAKFQEGVSAFGERRYADAVLAFRAADAIQPSAALSFNIARAFERLEETAAALRWYRDYLRRAPQATNAAEVQARVSELGAKLAQRGVQQLSVLSTPEGATVLIDSQPAGVTPLTTELAPGVHHLVLRAAGYGALATDVTLQPRVPRDVNLTLTLSAATAGEAGSSAAARTPEPGSSSSANGAAVPAADKPTRPFGVLPWVVLGAGGASLLGALGFELGRRSAESAAEEAPQRTYQAHFESMQSRQTAARVLLGVGGALLVGGGALLVLNVPQAPATKVGLGCVPGGCRAVAGVSF